MFIYYFDFVQNQCYTMSEHNVQHRVKDAFSKKESADKICYRLSGWLPTRG